MSLSEASRRRGHPGAPLALDRRCRALLAVTLGAAMFAASAPARADGFAEPPGEQRSVAFVPSRSSSRLLSEPFEPEAELSVLRFLVGPAGRLAGGGATAGFFLAADIGRGPAGGRLSAAWLDVGGPRGLAQYTGELTLDFGGHSWLRPVIGAGGGVVRTSSSRAADGSVDPTTGATIGVGLLRTGLGVRLPFESVDARVALDVTGTLPAIRGSDAPELTPWVLGALSLGIGF